MGGGTGLPPSPEPRAALKRSCCKPKSQVLALAGGRRACRRSRAETSFISVQVPRSCKFDVSVAINLMKPMKRGSNPPGWAHPRSRGRPALERCPAGVQSQLWHRPRGRMCPCKSPAHRAAPKGPRGRAEGMVWHVLGAEGLQEFGEGRASVRRAANHLAAAGPRREGAWRQEGWDTGSQSIPVQGPRASQCRLPEHPSAAPSLLQQAGEDRASPHLPTLPFPPPLPRHRRVLV